MPPRKQPSSLLSICKCVIETIIESGDYDGDWLVNVGEAVPYSLADEILDNVITSLRKGDGSVGKCFDLQPLFTAKIKELKFEMCENDKDDSEHLQHLLKFTTQCTNLQKLVISEDVCKNMAPQVQELLKSIDFSQHLKTLHVKSCLYVLNNPEVTLHLLNKLIKMPLLEDLDISGAIFDEDCFRMILRFRKLISLVLNNCKLTSIQVLQMLTGMPFLKNLEINYGKQSKVIQAISTLPSGTKLNLEKMTFRQPPRPSFYTKDTLKMVSKLTSLKVIWNIFDIGYSSAIDEGLVKLHLFENVTKIHFEISMINMLYIIQLGAKLESIAENITRFDFYEPELVHPASLDFVASLPRLKHLKMVNPSVIGDDMFLELPELCSTPFPQIETISYEGDVTNQLLEFLTINSPNLVKLELYCSKSVLDPGCLRNLHVEPKNKLETLIIELIVETSGKKFINELQKITENTSSLQFIGNIGNCSNVNSKDISDLESWIRTKKYDLKLC